MADSEKLSLLLIDDSEAILMFLKTKLKDKYGICTAATEEDALKILSNNKIDVIISDLRIPSLEEGLALNFKIKKDYPEIPVLAYSGTFDEDEKDFCLKFGFSSYIQKGRDSENLIAEIEKSGKIMPAKNILLIDDDESFTEAIKQLVANYNDHFFYASSGAEALELCRKFPFYLVVTDIMMPEMGGIEFINKARKEGTIEKIIIFSAFIDEKIREDLKSLDAVEILMKPLGLDKLLELVSS